MTREPRDGSAGRNARTARARYDARREIPLFISRVTCPPSKDRVTNRPAVRGRAARGFALPLRLASRDCCRRWRVGLRRSLEDVPPAPAKSAPAPLPAVTGRPKVQAWSGIVVDGRSGAVLWAKSADRRLEPASCAKIMTALVVLEHFRDLTRVRAGARRGVSRRSSIGLRPGERITCPRGAARPMVHSANDAALTLADAVAG